MGKSRTTVELFRGLDDKWYFHKKHPNGKISSHSQGYKHKRSAKKAAQRDIPGIEIVEVDQ